MMFLLHDRRYDVRFRYVSPWTWGWIDDGERHLDGVALCSATDAFVKAVGRKIAFTRALMGFTREERREIWRQMPRLRG
jgi:hypothetical protein